MLALIPLGVSLATPEVDDDVSQRFEQTLESVEPEQQDAIWDAVDANDEKAILAALPRGRLVGAALSGSSRAHWILGLLSAALFLGTLLYAFPRGEATVGQMLASAAFTGTVGIVLLLGLQAVADAYGGYIVVGIGPFAMLSWFLKFIAFSYSAAADASNGFLISFLGYAGGVGFCEEVCKILPVWFVLVPTGLLLKRATGGWQTVLAIGFASGVGFGVSEGIHYSSEMYNGVFGWLIYAVRFLSCVGLHSVWAGAAAIQLWRSYETVDRQSSLWGHVGALFVVLAVPILMHAAYDTALTRGAYFIAFLTALVSFGWLFYQVEQSALEPTGGTPQPA